MCQLLFRKLCEKPFITNNCIFFLNINICMKPGDLQKPDYYPYLPASINFHSGRRGCICASGKAVDSSITCSFRAGWRAADRNSRESLSVHWTYWWTRDRSSIAIQGWKESAGSNGVEARGVFSTDISKDKNVKRNIVSWFPVSYESCASFRLLFLWCDFPSLLVLENYLLHPGV